MKVGAPVPDEPFTSRSPVWGCHPETIEDAFSEAVMGSAEFANGGEPAGLGVDGAGEADEPRQIATGGINDVISNDSEVLVKSMEESSNSTPPSGPRFFRINCDWVKAKP